MKPASVPFTDPVQRIADELVREKGGAIGAFKAYSKPNCKSCGGKGFIATLKRAGATDKEPRVARPCGCVQKRLRKEAQRRIQEKHENLR
jgi:hypothetical protein